MRIITNRYDPNDTFGVMSKKEKHIAEYLFENPQAVMDARKWAEGAGVSVDSVRRFKKRLPELIGPCVEYMTKQCFLPIWFSLLRRAMKDEDIKAKELLMKSLRILKDEAPPEILAIFNITNNYQQKEFLDDVSIDKILQGHGPMEALKP